jgi:hypothetical protein
MQSFQITNNLCPQRIQMNIPDQFLQIGIFLAYDGLISVLEKLTVALVPPIIRYRISGKQSSHESGNTSRTASEQKMGMIR